MVVLIHSTPQANVGKRFLGSEVRGLCVKRQGRLIDKGSPGWSLTHDLVVISLEDSAEGT